MDLDALLVRLSAINPHAGPRGDLRQHVAQVKEGLRRQRAWCRRRDRLDAWPCPDLASLLTAAPRAEPPLALREHPTWAWSTPWMRAALISALAWPTLPPTARVAPDPYAPWMTVIDHGVRFGRDHTGGVQVDMAWFGLRDPTVYDTDVPFI